MFKVTFDIPRGTAFSGKSPQGLCVPLPGGPLPEKNETWIVDIVKRVSSRVVYVRLIRKWRGVLSDYLCVQKGQPDFRKGLLVFHGGKAFPLSDTSYARAWGDYQMLAEQPNAVIIREKFAIRWRKKGQPPEEMPLYRFATKYKRQPLLGKREDIDEFLQTLKKLVAQTVEESRRKKVGLVPKSNSGYGSGLAQNSVLS